jgi:stage V sporulation protein B
LGKPAGELLFGSSLAGTFICRLSVLCPFLYLHTTLASILNGLKKTGYTLMINILSLLIRLGFTLFAVPQVGISGYILGLFLSELISALLCVWGLRRYYR